MRWKRSLGPFECLNPTERKIGTHLLNKRSLSNLEQLLTTTLYTSSKNNNNSKCRTVQPTLDFVVISILLWYALYVYIHYVKCSVPKPSGYSEPEKETCWSVQNIFDTAYRHHTPKIRVLHIIYQCTKIYTHNLVRVFVNSVQRPYALCCSIAVQQFA